MFREEPRLQAEKEQEFPFIHCIRNEDLLEKLKLLKYESELLAVEKVRPIHKTYFLMAKNPGEQFYMFTLLAWWLIKKTGREFEKPQESDDPNATISNILEFVRSTGGVIDFAPNKLKQGVGEYVLYVLDHFAECAFQKNGFSWKKPVAPQEKTEEIEAIEDESEIILDRVEEEMLAAYSDGSDEENIFHVRDFAPTKTEKQEVEVPNINQEAWSLELEKVLPQLKITITNDSRDWRGHLEQMKNYKNSIDSSVTAAKAQMEKLHKDIVHTLDKIQSRERYLNKELEPILNEYRALQDQLFRVKDTYSSISGGVAERNRQLSILTDRLEMVKQQMEERGSSMTDGTPLVNIRKAIARVKAEISEMDVRIGVLECVVLQSKLQEKKMLEEDVGHRISVF